MRAYGPTSHSSRYAPNIGASNASGARPSGLAPGRKPQTVYAGHRMFEVNGVSDAVEAAMHTVRDLMQQRFDVAFHAQQYQQLRSAITVVTQSKEAEEDPTSAADVLEQANNLIRFWREVDHLDLAPLTMPSPSDAASHWAVDPNTSMADLPLPGLVVLKEPPPTHKPQAPSPHTDDLAPRAINQPTTAGTPPRLVHAHSTPESWAWTDHPWFVQNTAAPQPKTQEEEKRTIVAENAAPPPKRPRRAQAAKASNASLGVPDNPSVLGASSRGLAAEPVLPSPGSPHLDQEPLHLPAYDLSWPSWLEPLPARIRPEFNELVDRLNAREVSSHPVLQQAQIDGLRQAFQALGMLALQAKRRDAYDLFEQWAVQWINDWRFAAAQRTGSHQPPVLMTAQAAGLLDGAPWSLTVQLS